MSKVFFTYTWGMPGEPAWPLTFKDKGTRNSALRELGSGDLVFTVCTKGEPTPLNEQGLVGGVYELSDIEIDTSDYELPRDSENPRFDGVSRFPFALHPIKVWRVTSPDSFFSKLVGPLTPAHHFRAQSQIVKLDALTAARLLALEKQEVSRAEPKTEFGRSQLRKRLSRLAPAHSGPFTGEFRHFEKWFVYTLVLRDERGRYAQYKVRDVGGTFRLVPGNQRFGN